MNVCSPGTVKDLCTRYGFSFQKSLGQNFLINPDIPARIAQGSGADAQTAVVEIGPGFGALTDALAAVAGAVTAVELDEKLLPVLAETLADRPNATVVRGDVRKVDFEALCARMPFEKRIAVANLPYYITTESVLRLLNCGQFQSVTVMIQREAANKLLCAPGSPDWCLFSLLANHMARIKKLFPVGKSNFMPAPSVESTVVRMDLIPPRTPEREAAFTAVAKALFASRRKTACNMLSPLFPDGRTGVQEVLIRVGLPLDVRGENLPPETVEHLADLWLAQTGGQGVETR